MDFDATTKIHDTPGESNYFFGIGYFSFSDDCLYPLDYLSKGHDTETRFDKLVWIGLTKTMVSSSAIHSGYFFPVFFKPCSRFWHSPFFPVENNGLYRCRPCCQNYAPLDALLAIVSLTILFAPGNALVQGAAASLATRSPGGPALPDVPVHGCSK